MIEGRPFLYQAIGGTVVYHVAEKSVETVQSWSSEKTIVALVDGGEGDYKPDDPPPWLAAANCDIIPRRRKLKMDQANSSRLIRYHPVIKLWSHEELLLTRLVLALL